MKAELNGNSSVVRYWIFFLSQKPPLFTEYQFETDQLYQSLKRLKRKPGCFGKWITHRWLPWALLPAFRCHAIESNLPLLLSVFSVASPSSLPWLLQEEVDEPAFWWCSAFHFLAETQVYSVTVEEASSLKRSSQQGLILCVDLRGTCSHFLLIMTADTACLSASVFTLPPLSS